MRTTVEIKAEHRARLLEIPARRGRKGLYSVLAEAIDRFLAVDQPLAARRKKLKGLRGCLSDREASALRQQVQEMRERWR